MQLNRKRIFLLFLAELAMMLGSIEIALAKEMATPAVQNPIKLPDQPMMNEFSGSLTKKSVKADKGIKPNIAILKLPNGSEVIASKVFPIQKYDGVKKDGETAFTVSNGHVTLFHIKEPNGYLSTQAVVDFYLTNHTQNDKGEHKHRFVVNIHGAFGNAFPNRYEIELQRDTCSPSNPVIAGPHIYPLDIYDQVDGISWGWYGKWNYEGKC